MKTNLQSRLLLVLLLLSTGLTACIGVNANGNTSGKVQTISLSPISSTSSVTSSVAHPVSDSVLDGIVKEALVSINQYGWGDSGRNGPGIYINWYRNDPTAHQNSGHDGQNDIRDYENMVWYEARHPGDTSLLAATARLLPTIKAEWGQSSLPKGWVYFLFQRLVQLSGDSELWTNAMKNWASHVYGGIVPALGVSHGPVIDSTAHNAPRCSDGYRVDQNIENGLALVDAGTRFGNPEWIRAGANEVNVIIRQGFVSKYHLFARIVCQGKIWNWEARGGEIGQITDALLKVGSYTKNNAYLTLAEQILDAVTNPALGLRDLKNGGIYYKFLLDTGTVDTSRKEMRQFAILQAVHKANAVFNNRYASFEVDLINVAKHAFFSPPVAGWMYELSNNWSLYKGKENWISMEASGMAMEAIQTVLSN